MVESLFSVEAMQGVHAGRYERGNVFEYLREMKAEDKRRECEHDERLGRHR